MTGEGEDDRPSDAPNDAESARDEPLGDLAERVREQTGGRGSGGERRRPDEERRGSGGDRRSSPETTRREGPLADVASEVDERRRRSREETSDPFESVDVGELDGEKLWEDLAAGEEESGASLSPDEAIPVEGSADAGAGRDVRTIPKDTCHGCPHLGDPPELHCTHEGTDILAMPDADHFRVADCPMVVSGEEDIGGIVGGDGEFGDDEFGDDELGDDAMTPDDVADDTTAEDGVANGVTTEDGAADGATDEQETADGPAE